MTLDPEQISWQVVNDVVMGGCSSATCKVGQGAGSLRFSGLLSTAHGGGFASVRGELGRPVPPFSAVRLVVSGDGRQYQVRLRETAHPEAIAWRALFTAQEDRETIVLGLDDFEPVFRGRRVEALPGLTRRDIRFLGFMVVSKQPGAFALTVHQIETVDRDD